MRTKRGGTAFTLIELLVVISLIALLISLLLPALSSARAAARGAQCQSRMRQMGIAYFNYATDYNGQLPPIQGNREDDTVPIEDGFWFNSILPYVGITGYSSDDLGFPYPIPKIIENDIYGENVFHCPVTLHDGPIFTPGSFRDEVEYTYGPNFWPLYVAGGDGIHESFDLDHLLTPSETVMHGELASFHLRPHWYFTSVGLRPHNGATHFLFHDGHVERVQYEDVPEARDSVFWAGEHRIRVRSGQ